MKQTLLNVVTVLGIFAVGVLFNCGLIYLGFMGLVTACMILVIGAAGLVWEDSIKTPLLVRWLLLLAIALMYIYTIWCPETWVVAISGMTILLSIIAAKDYPLTEYVSVFVLYILAWDVAFYVMGDPILDFVDAELLVLTLGCMGVWWYHHKALIK